MDMKKIYMHKHTLCKYIKKGVRILEGVGKKDLIFSVSLGFLKYQNYVHILLV